MRVGAIVSNYFIHIVKRKVQWHFIPVLGARIIPACVFNPAFLNVSISLSANDFFKKHKCPKPVELFHHHIAVPVALNLKVKGSSPWKLFL